MTMTATITTNQPLCDCDNPFCGKEHAPIVFTLGDFVDDDGADDLEGPMQPEYSEYDEESQRELEEEARRSF